MSTAGFEQRLRREQQPADDPVLLGELPNRIVHLHALGAPFRLETNDERIERVAVRAFGPLDPHCHAGDGVTLRLMVHDVPEEDGWRPVQPVLRGQGDYFYAAASRSSVVCGDTVRGFAFGFISNQQADHEEHLRSTMILSPFLWIATAKSLSAIHCACVSYNSTALMLRGRPNAGKTTLAYAALRSGFSLLCEDVAFAWGKPDGGLELRGMPWLLYLKPDAVNFFPELGNLEPIERYNGESKILIEVAEHFPDQHIESAPFGPTVFVERSPNGRNRLIPLEREDALKRYEATRIAMEHRRSGEVDIWGTMLEQQAYRFEVGPDPLAAAEVLKQLCGG
jgi:hypothetical protein